MADQTNPREHWSVRIQAVDSKILYLVLFLVVSLSLVLTNIKSIRVPTAPQEYTKETYKILRNIPEGKTIIIDTEYTNSSRGENGGQMEAVLRMCMRQKVKFVLYTMGEPQCIEVAKDVIRKINEEQVKAGRPAYRHWFDYVNLGVFTDGASMLQSVASSGLKVTWSTKFVKDDQGQDRSPFDSPVLQNIKGISDIQAYVNIAASNTMPVIVARLSKTDVPILSMITGVMFPEQLNYYKTGQLKGLVNGLVGTVEMESLMETGIDNQGDPGGKASGPPQAAGFPGEKNFSRGMDYYLAFCVAMTLLIVAIIIGNIGMVVQKRSNR
jgi:hypothetical protein